MVLRRPLVGAAWAFYSGNASWRAWSLIGAPLSVAGIALWASRELPPGTYVGAATRVLVFAYALLAG